MQICDKAWVKRDRFLRGRRLAHLFFQKLFNNKVDLNTGHLYEKHGERVSRDYLERRVREENVPAATKFTSDFHEWYARQYFLEHHYDAMNDAMIKSGQTEYWKTVTLPQSCGWGIDVAGNRVDNISSVRFGYSFDQQTGVWQEVTGYPIQRRRR